MATSPRPPALITWTTWKALFLRTAVARVSASRLAAFWILFEPVAFTVLLMLAFTFLRVRHIGGISTAVWIMAGVLSFITFRRAASEAMNAIGRSRSLFTYPQVRPADPVVVNAALEGFVMVLVSIVLLAGATLVGFDVVPADPLAVIEAMAGMWIFGLGYGMVNSVALVVWPPLGAVLSFMLLRPLYLLSGVIIPVTVLPYPYRDWLMMNPLVHGLEMARLGFAPHYRVPPQISIGYLYLWAVVIVFLGLALQVRYRHRLEKGK